MKFSDYKSDSEFRDIMEKLLAKFPDAFKGFDIDGIHFIMTCGKKGRMAARIHRVGYPAQVFVGKPYIVEIFEDQWKESLPKQKNLTVFHVMCAIPEGGFDPESAYYARKVPPEFEMYMMEFVVSGGVPDWKKNDSASDPMDVEPDVVNSSIVSTDSGPIPPIGKKSPVTAAA